ncbi:MAG TPA: MFS transporter [Acetobacteraceae bacterium]|nr:MFS transporter [Acetobacteraceae bacterium]
MTWRRTLVLSPPGRMEQVSTWIAFFISGFGTAAWAPLVPFAKARVGLGNGTLGLVLLCLGAGSIMAMPLSGTATARFGCRAVLLTAAGLMCLALPLLTLASSASFLAGTLFLFGAGAGALDCTTNIQAIIVERASGRPMMSGFHALFSIGGIVGAAVVSVLLSFGVTPFLSALGVAIGIALAMSRAEAHFLRYGAAGRGPLFAIPRGIVLFIGILCFVVYLTEGSALDWSAVFLTSVRGVKPAYAGLGYVAFASMMALVRLGGDGVVQRFGRGKIVVMGGLVAASGLALVALVPVWPIGLLGYALVGAGCANLVPILITLAGGQKDMPEHVAVPAVSTLGYAGMLAGPAAIGFLAHAASLSAAFLVVALLLLGVGMSGFILRTRVT